MFSDGFVEVLAAEQTPDSSNWFQGTADAVRQAARHFVGHDSDHYLILAGDHLYRMDFNELIDSHIESRADITIAAQPVTAADAARWAFSGSTTADRSAVSRKSRRRLADMHSIPRHADDWRHDRGETLRRVDGDLCSPGRARDLDQPGIDTGKVPKALGNHKVNPYIFRGYWAGWHEDAFTRRISAHAARRAV
jgi:glucose-1-phosphate adenylyltransferase